MKIQLKTLTGKSYYLDVEPTDYVLAVQEKIQDQAGIPPDQQRIIYQGKQLDIERTLADYNVQDNAILHLLLKLRKPIILFYGFQGPFTCSIRTEHPENFICFPKPIKDLIQWKGQIKNNQLIIDGKKYPYLFWEYERLELGKLKPHFKFSRQEISDKVFTLVSRLGLNQTQACNFVTYWVNSWQRKSYWFVHILNQEIINKLFPLEITPKPKQIKRIYLLFGGENENDQIIQQFKVQEWKMSEEPTVIQWGGAECIIANDI